jgi:hypothetical protein
MRIETEALLEWSLGRTQKNRPSGLDPGPAIERAEDASAFIVDDSEASLQVDGLRLGDAVFRYCGSDSIDSHRHRATP